MNTIHRPGFVTFLAVLHFLGTAVWVGGLAICMVGAGSASADARFVLNILAGIFAVLAALQFACGFGLWSLRPYGRILQIILAIPYLLAIPFWTAISILLLVYMNKPGIKLMFSGRPATNLSPEERTAVNVASGVPGVAVAMIVLISIVPLFMVPVTAAIAIPGLLRARIIGNETAAIEALDKTTLAQAAYLTSCGHGGYAASYAVLGAPVSGRAPFISADLGGSATPQRRGYSFTLQAGAESKPGPADCMGRPTVSSWYATARPQQFGATGTRSFAATDIDGVWESRDRLPPVEPFRRPSIRVH